MFKGTVPNGGACLEGAEGTAQSCNVGASLSCRGDLQGPRRPAGLSV